GARGAAAHAAGSYGQPARPAGQRDPLDPRDTGGEAVKIPIVMFALVVAAPVSGQRAAPDVLGLRATAIPAGLVEARFGEAVPVLGCAALRACRVEMEPGERLLSPPALGDTERWLTAEISSGPGGLVPVVVVKPTACGISTNLVIATDRRIYDLD